MEYRKHINSVSKIRNRAITSRCRHLVVHQKNNLIRPWTAIKQRYWRVPLSTHAATNQSVGDDIRLLRKRVRFSKSHVTKAFDPAVLYLRFLERRRHRHGSSSRLTAVNRVLTRLSELPDPCRTRIGCMYILCASGMRRRWTEEGVAYHLGTATYNTKGRRLTITPS